MQNIVLEVKNLTKKFSGSSSGGGEFTAVDNISFAIGNGEVLGLLGPNGAGKTTTIQMLLGVMEPTQGTIVYFGKEFKKHREEVLKNINYSSTYISLPWHFTVMEILDIFADLYEVDNKKKRIQKLLEEFEMDSLQKKTFSMLSAGEKTRLLLTKAFLNYPKIILLDEPTASLDPDIAVKVKHFLQKEKKEYNVSMLFTSHNMTEVEEMCDRILILHHGKIIDEDTPDNLTRRMSSCKIELLIKEDTTKAFAFFTETKTSFTQEKFMFKITTEEKEIPNFLSLLAKKKIEYQQISINKPDLEDYFLQAIEKEKT